ncbi:hypothetical protein B0H19DRAFT_885698, partial [Mycena capillaripes]
MKSAKKLHLIFDALALSKDIKEELPIFFHIGAKKDLTKHNNSTCAKCLRDHHRARSVGDILKIVERNYYRHYRRRNCACTSCKADRQMRCDSPYKCQEEAIKFLACLYEKWEPRQPVNQPNSDLTLDEKEANHAALKSAEIVTFDPKIKLTKLVDGFRIFGGEVCELPANQLDPQDDEDEPSEETVFIGNSHHVNDDGEHCSSGSIWYSPQDPRNKCIPVRKELSSKEAGEASAVLYTIQNTP